MKKVSVIIPCYGTEDFIEECINSIFNQSYKNLEIIAVNDCSPGNMTDILNQLKEKDDRLKIVQNKENKGLFHTRIVGSKVATGDYISFVDSDDYVDVDYYRLLVNKAINDKCDVVLANYVRTNEINEYIAGLSFNTNNETYDGKEFYEMFFNQTGRIIRNHMLCSKLISMDIWKLALKEVENVKEKIVMTEDFAFSSINLYYAKKVGYCDNAIYYYRNNDNQSTSQNNITVEKINKNISDIIVVFNFVQEFLQKQKIYNKYKEKFEIWKSFYLSMHVDIYKKMKKKNQSIQELKYDYENDNELQKFYEIRKTDKSWDNYHGLITPFDSRFIKIKENILNDNVEIVSFDMFDTLISRPFFLPSDMFLLLNKLFIELFNPIQSVDFSRIRKNCEMELREINYKKGIQEVTLDGIYDYMARAYNLDRKKLDIIEEKEMEMELHFCRRRNSGYELYTLAKEAKKKVILTSDIYLPKKFIEKLAKKNGYEFDELYVSSELLKTKANGSLFEYIIEQEKTKNIVHIGDNYISDLTKPQEYGLQSFQLFKAIDVMMGYTEKNVGNCGKLYKKFMAFNYDHIPYEENYGVRCSLAIAANYYFDNPFRSFNSYSDFNGDPYFIGFYALGMQNLALCNWLLNDAKINNIDSISFMARDGYLPYKSALTFQKYIDKYNNIKLNYIYVSRKSLMPLLLRDKSGISMIETYLNYLTITPKDLIKQIISVIKYDSKIEKELSETIKLNKVFESKKEFTDTLSLIYDKCFDKDKYNNYFNMCKKYFSENFIGNASTFDIGYSGKPEAIISTVLDKPITTYFIHVNNSNAFNNMSNCNSVLKTFFDYKPTLTGTIRELFISSTGPSCIGYEYKDNKIVPVFVDKGKYSYYNIDMINKIQKGSSDFLNTFLDFFGNYINQIDLNKYYMSLPFEYYCHYVQMEDRLPTKNLLFEDNVNNYVEINKFIFDIYNNYAKEYSLGTIPKKYEEIPVLNINYNLPKSRFKRIIYYTFLDKKELKSKWNEWAEKKNDQLLLPSSRFKRIIYYMVFDRKTLKKKIFRK